MRSRASTRAPRSCTRTRPTCAPSARDAARDYLAAWEPILAERPDALWYPTLCQDAGMAAMYVALGAARAQGASPHRRLRPWLDQPRHAGPGRAAERRRLRRLLRRRAHGLRGCAKRLRLGPSLGIYEPGALRTVLAWRRARRLPRGTLVKLYFGGEYGLFATRPGVSFGLPPTERALDALPRAARGLRAALVGLGLGRRPDGDADREARARARRPPARGHRGVLLARARAHERRARARGHRARGRGRPPARVARRGGELLDLP